MNWVFAALLTLLGVRWVGLADETYLRIANCRFRDYSKLSRRADNYSVCYLFSAFLGLAFYPVGLIPFFVVLGYAFYCWRRSRLPVTELSGTIGRRPIDDASRPIEE